MPNFDEARLPYSRDYWDLKQCRSCRFVYLENPPAYEALSEDFAWENTVRLEDERRAALEPRLHELSRKISQFRRRILRRNKLARLVNRYFEPGPLLDVGCGAGRALRNIPAGCVPHGVEVSAQLAAAANLEAQARGGHVVHADALNGITTFEPRTFKSAIVASFLEHEANPGGLLANLARVMLPGGRIVIKVPNYGSFNRIARGSRWCGFRFPDHVNYFTPASLRQLVEVNGFIVDRFRFADRHPFSDNMWMIARRPANGAAACERVSEPAYEPDLSAVMAMLSVSQVLALPFLV